MMNHLLTKVLNNIIIDICFLRNDYFNIILVARIYFMLAVPKLQPNIFYRDIKYDKFERFFNCTKIIFYKELKDQVIHNVFTKRFKFNPEQEQKLFFDYLIYIEGIVIRNINNIFDEEYPDIQLTYAIVRIICKKVKG